MPLVFGVLTSIQVTVNAVLCGENQLKFVRHGVYYILITHDINVCVILCIVTCSLDILSVFIVCFPHSRLLNQFQSAVSALVQKSKIGRRNLKSSSLVLTVATVVGDHLQCC